MYDGREWRRKRAALPERARPLFCDTMRYHRKQLLEDLGQRSEEQQGKGSKVAHVAVAGAIVKSKVPDRFLIDIIPMVNLEKPTGAAEVY